MYYKIDLSNYKPRKVLEYQTFTDYFDIHYRQIDMIAEELDNFKDSFDKDWQEWKVEDLRNRLESNTTMIKWTFYLHKIDYKVCGWSFIDWSREYPYLCNRYVFPEYRNKGLGSDIVWSRCNEVKEQGFDTAMIKLEDWNKPALSVMKENIFTKMD